MKVRRRKSRQRHTWFTIWQYETTPCLNEETAKIKISEK